MSERRITASQALPDGLVDQEQELGVIGSLMFNPATIDQLPPGFSSDCFAVQGLADCFDAIMALAEKGEANIASALRVQVPDLLTSDLIRAICDSSFVTSNPLLLRGAAQSVKELHDRRTLLAFADSLKLQIQAGALAQPTAALVNRAMTQLDSISESVRISRKGVTLRQAVDSMVEAAERAYQGEQEPAVMTGIRAFDDHTGGLRNQRLYVIGGRPAMGKTALALGWAVHAAMHGQRTVFFSLEMGREELASRFLAPLLRVPGDKIEQGKLTQQQWNALAVAQGQTDGVPLFVEDQPGLTMQEIRLRCRAYARAAPLRLVVVDHLSLVSHAPDLVRLGGTAGIADTTRRMKFLSKEFDCPVVLLSQLSREVESRDDKRPVERDLRDSGTIEQDADGIIMVYRDEFYLSKDTPRRRDGEASEKFGERYRDWESRLSHARGRGELLIRKLRHGGPRTIQAAYDAPVTCWSDLEEDQCTPGEELPL